MSTLDVATGRFVDGGVMLRDVDDPVSDWLGFDTFEECIDFVDNKYGPCNFTFEKFDNVQHFDVWRTPF